MFILQPSSGIPLYRQLIEQVRRLIAGGQLAPGSELPSVREIAVTYAVNPMTVSKAYALLETEGLLERRRGKPMIVAARPRGPESLAQRRAQLEPQVRQLVLAARQLELTPTELQAQIDLCWGQRHDD